MRYSIEKGLAQNDIERIVALIRQEKHAFPFLPAIVFEDSANRREIFVLRNNRHILGFIRYHHRRDGITTVHEIMVAKEYRGQGLGRLLVERLVTESVERDQIAIRLKCPLDLRANGFYSRLGFQRIAVEDGKKQRLLAIWEKPVETKISQQTEYDCINVPALNFYLTLTHEPSETRKVICLWEESGDPRNPFAHIIFTPLFSNSGTIALIHQLKDERGSIVMFDSGGYQVQMGKVGYESLFDLLRRFYMENNWADWYVLPDHVPYSTDSDREVDFKVMETLDFAKLFLQMMPNGFAEKAIGVVHGRTKEHIYRCVEVYANIGIRYLGFGSFGTSGPNGRVNLVSKKSLDLLCLLQVLAEENNLRLHVFGIGSPSHLIRLADAGITPASFDSAGWWKAGGFGNIFFPGGRQLHITAIPNADATLAGVKRQKKRSRHECAFCSQLKLLRRSRMNRILHNLASMLDTLSQMRGEL